MIICVTEKNGETHVVDYITPSKKINSVCGKSLRHVFNTYAADNTFRGMCKNCESIYTSMYEDDLNFDLAMSHSNLLSSVIRKLVLSETQLLSIDVKYSGQISKNWNKLFKIKRSLNRK